MPKTLEGIDVLILCGGMGKRLKKVSGLLPKPMVEIGGRPFLDIIIDYMAGFGFKRFILGTGYRADIIEDYYSKKPKKGLNILFCREKTPLDTGGAVKNARRLIKSKFFFVLNGDSFCKFDPIKFMSFYKKKKALVSILLRKEPKGSDYGEIKIDRNSRILSFNEKNRKVKKCLINAGVYIFDTKIFKLMPLGLKFS
ncbi:MAG: sugar phosphate nucleotidyltransferase, partial [Candidatus Omnitrophota bacterium]